MLFSQGRHGRAILSTFTRAVTTGDAMKHKAGILVTLIALTIVAVAVVNARRSDSAPGVTTAQVTRGSIVNAVSATGTLEAVTTVQVGSQVSGAVESLNAD